LFPELSIVLRQRKLTLRAPMPETTMHKDCDPLPPEAYIWATRNYFGMKTISMYSTIPEGFPQYPLWFRVLCPVSLHRSRRRRRRRGWVSQRGLVTMAFCHRLPFFFA